MYKYKPQTRVFAYHASSSRPSDQPDGKNGASGSTSKSGRQLLRGAEFVLVSSLVFAK